MPDIRQGHISIGKFTTVSSGTGGKSESIQRGGKDETIARWRWQYIDEEGRSPGHVVDGDICGGVRGYQEPRPGRKYIVAVVYLVRCAPGRDCFRKEGLNEMAKVKTVLLIISGVAILVLGLVLRSLLDRRGSGGIGSALDDARGHSDAAGSALDAAGHANRDVRDGLDDIRRTNSELQAGNTLSERLLKRSRDILAKAKARADTTGG